MANYKTYRDRLTGAVQVYPEALAAVFTNLEEVAPDAKPLTYALIPKPDSSTAKPVEAKAEKKEKN